MIKKTLSFVAIVIMVLLGACSNDEILPEPNPEPKPEVIRTLSLTVNTPAKGDPDTRVALTPGGENNKDILLTWEVGDVLELAFVQGTQKGKSTVTLTANNISNEGKRAQFDITLPATFLPNASFDLYGVYGGGGINITGTNPVAKLPNKAGSATSLNGSEDASVQKRKDAMLYFVNKGITLTEANTHVAVTFQHLGTFFSITLKNTGGTTLNNLAEAQLIGVGGDAKWAYNSVAGGQTYDLTTGKFQNTTTAGNNISFKTASSTLAGGDSITFWAWYPPTGETAWPKLKLELKGTNTTIATSINNTPNANTPSASKTYHFFAT